MQKGFGYADLGSVFNRCGRGGYGLVRLAVINVVIVVVLRRLGRCHGCDRGRGDDDVVDRGVAGVSLAEKHTMILRQIAKEGRRKI